MTMVNPKKNVPVNRLMQGRDNNMRRDMDRRNERRGKNERPRRLDSDDKGPEKKEVKEEKIERPDVEEQSEDKAVAAEGSAGDRKFTGRCRLFVGNLSPETTEKEFKEMFEEFGECSEMFLNANRAFGFIRMDTRENAEKAKKALDGTVKKGRYLRVRFAAHTAAIRVKYLHPFVSNELLAEAFSMFGEIERAIVCIDEKGKPNGEGIVEFARKPGALQALKRVNEGVFLLGSSPRPVSCELVEHKDEEDGLPEVFMNKNQDFHKERDCPPRFASQGSFEHNFSLKWKELYAQHEQRKHQLQMEFDESMSKLEMDESTALMEHQTQLLREDLMRRQEELRRMEEQHQMEIQRKMDLRRNQEEAKRQMDEERRREEEARMFMQQELAMRQMQADERHRSFQGSGSGNRGPGGNMGGNAPPMQPPPAPPAGLSGPGSHSSGGPPGHRGRNSEMGMGNRGMNQGGGPSGMQSSGMGMQGHGNMNPQQMQNMRGRKSDADYRQSRFDQPPQHFQMNPQQQQQQQQQQAQQQMGNQQQMNMMPGGQMMGMPGGNMGNGGGPPNQGRGQMMHEGPRGKHANSEGSDSGQGEYYEKKRSRRF